VEKPHSALVPDMDLDALVECAQLPSINQAVKAFRESWNS